VIKGYAFFLIYWLGNYIPNFSAQRLQTTLRVKSQKSPNYFDFELGEKLEFFSGVQIAL